MAVSFTTVLAAIFTIVLFAYLIFALVRPERF